MGRFAFATDKSLIFNRCGVAGAVLHTPLSFIHSLITPGLLDMASTFERLVPLGRKVSLILKLYNTFNKKKSILANRDERHYTF